MKSGNVSLNASLASAPDYLRERLRLSTSQQGRKRSNSIGSCKISGTPSYKSQEDMYDEILALKKDIIAQKNTYDILKAKTRRLEEENNQKDKYIEKLLDPSKNGEMIRTLNSRESKSGGSVISGLKQHQMKLEKQLKEKEKELSLLKNDLKTTNIEEMKGAMEIYYQEVLRMRDAVTRERLYSESGNVPKKIKKLRESVVRLQSEHNRTLEENRNLKVDLTRALDYDALSVEGEEPSPEYSSLTKLELIAIIKKMKHSQKQKNESYMSENTAKQDKLKNVLNRLKEERNELQNEVDSLHQKTEKLEDKLERECDEKDKLKRKLEESEELVIERAREKREGQEKRVKSFKENKAASSIQRQWRHRKEKEKEGKDVIVLQSAFRGHLSREHYLNSSKSIKSFNSVTSKYSEYNSDSESVVESSHDDSDIPDEDVILLQSALRGHLNRTSHVKNF